MNNNRMNWYKPYTYIGQLEDSKDIYYISIILPLPKGVYVADKKIDVEIGENTKINQVKISIFIDLIPDGDKIREKDFWTEEFMLDGLHGETGLSVEVFKVNAIPVSLDNQEPLELLFPSTSISDKEMAEIMSDLSDIYRTMTGDSLVIGGVELLELDAEDIRNNKTSDIVSDEISVKNFPTKQRSIPLPMRFKAG